MQTLYSESVPLLNGFHAGHSTVVGRSECLTRSPPRMGSVKYVRIPAGFVLALDDGCCARDGVFPFPPPEAGEIVEKSGILITNVRVLGNTPRDCIS